MDAVHIINRTSKPLEALWDGHRHVIPVGESLQPWLVAQAAKAQNVLMGSQDPTQNYNDFGSIVSLIAIKGTDDDASPIEQNPKAVERWNRSYMPGGNKAVEIVHGRTGYGAARNPLPTELSFTPNAESAPIPKIPVT